MPIIVTFDIKKIDKNGHPRLKSMFKRFGWQAIGGSVFKYPSSEKSNEPEDWLNHVVPALMLLRTFVIAKELSLDSFCLSASSFTEVQRTPRRGRLPTNTKILRDPGKSDQAFGEAQLLKWIGDLKFPY